jgi:hypothetical protein
MTQVHKKFTAEQVKVLLISMERHEELNPSHTSSQGEAPQLYGNE